MKRSLLFIFLTLLASASTYAQPTTSPDDAELSKIALLIYQNECAGQTKNLVVWNQGEAFPSLGIGHFIWYPRGYRGPFKESFPALLEFMQLQHVSIPPALQKANGAPWANQDHFRQADQNTPEVEMLRVFLRDTMPVQARFMRERFNAALADILQAAPPKKRARLLRHYQRVADAPMGYYALMDYVNFKGEGTKASERYQGHGWGLLQVLEQMADGGDAIEAFADAATLVLERRVANAPPERNEARWLPGWKNRIASYVDQHRKFLRGVSTTR